eukprot:scaffold1105_cov140-Isochrysis_galbana.AAC.6
MAPPSYASALTGDFLAVPHRHRSDTGVSHLFQTPLNIVISILPLATVMDSDRHSWSPTDRPPLPSPVAPSSHMQHPEHSIALLIEHHHKRDRHGLAPSGMVSRLRGALMVWGVEPAPASLFCQRSARWRNCLQSAGVPHTEWGPSVCRLETPTHKGGVVCKALAGSASVCGQKDCRHKLARSSQASLELEHFARGLSSPCCPTLVRADASAPTCLSGPCRPARRPRKRGARQRAPPPC